MVISGVKNKFIDLIHFSNYTQLQVIIRRPIREIWYYCKKNFFLWLFIIYLPIIVTLYHPNILCDAVLNVILVYFLTLILKFTTHNNYSLK